MVCDDPLAAEYTISRINPAFTDESLSADCSRDRDRDGDDDGPDGASHRSEGHSPGRSSSGYDSRASSSSSALSRHWDPGQPLKCPQTLPQTLPQASPQALDGVRQLSEGVSRSPTLLAVCRALEAVGEGAGGGSSGGGSSSGGSGYLCYTPAAWSEYLGSGIVPGDITLKAKGYEVLDLTLDAEGAAHLLSLVELGTRRRCCCRAVTALLAAAVFLAAIMAVSMVVSRGQRVFGAL